MSEQVKTNTRRLNPELIRSLTKFLRSTGTRPSHGVKDDSALYLSTEQTKNYQRCIKEAPRLLGSLLYDIDEALRLGRKSHDKFCPCNGNWEQCHENPVNCGSPNDMMDLLRQLRML